MLDGVARRLLDPALDGVARRMAAGGVSADALTATGLALGLVAAGLIVAGLDLAALLVLLASRLCDGLDGAVAKATRRTDRGGYLDIVFDFAFYGAIPLAFALRAPEANGLPAAALLFAFYVNGASFLAYAALAAKRGLADAPRGEKSIHYTAGLAEATETILVFGAMCLAPAWFPALACGFAALTLASAIARIRLAWTVFGDADP